MILKAECRDPKDPFHDINSPAFLENLRPGRPQCEKAFRFLFQRTQARLTAHIRRSLADAGAVQDVLQETYMAAYRGLPSFEGRCKLSTWLFSLAYHKVCDRLSEKYRAHGAEDLRHGDLEVLESKDPWPDAALIEAELVRLIETIAHSLAPKYREVHKLRDFEGLSGGESARALGISESLVRLRLHRARGMIGKRMEWAL